MPEWNKVIRTENLKMTPMQMILRLLPMEKDPGLISMFREENFSDLSVENVTDASELQRIVLIVLDNLNTGNFRVDAARNAILNEISNRLMSLMPRTRALNPAVADRYNRYAITSRQLMVTQNET